MLRFRAETVRRAKAESEIREALGERERALHRELALRRELDHRVRNSLAGLAGLITLYERSGRPAAQIAQALRGKLEAMREVHDVINRASGGPVELATLVSRIADALIPGPRRAAFDVTGPRVPLTTGEASAMAMIVQELITNSLKHGALGTDEGRVEARWSASPDGTGATLSLDWVEGPVATERAEAVRGSGVGTSLVEGFARSDLGGDVAFEHDGGRWRVRLSARLATAGAFLRGAATDKEICV